MSILDAVGRLGIRGIAKELYDNRMESIAEVEESDILKFYKKKELEGYSEEQKKMIERFEAESRNINISEFKWFYTEIPFNAKGKQSFYEMIKFIVSKRPDVQENLKQDRVICVQGFATLGSEFGGLIIGFDGLYFGLNVTKGKFIPRKNIVKIENQGTTIKVFNVSGGKDFIELTSKASQVEAISRLIAEVYNLK